MPHRPPPGEPTRRGILAVLVGGAFAGIVGWVVGRRGARRRGASLGLSAALPARGRLAIDGRLIATPEPGKDIPVSPGRHTVSITLPRREAQTFDVVVDEGERVVLLVQPAANARRDRADDRTDGGRP